jgi:glycerophosphoryl diester phosphodiesterase
MTQMPDNYFKELIQKKKPLIMAHRGNRVAFPENTLASFKCAVDEGADILETDLHLSADDEFVCIHDETVDRTTDGKGFISSMTINEIKALRTTDHQACPTEHRVPTLPETADFLPSATALALELKTDRFLDVEVCKRLGLLLKDRQVLNRSIAISFSLRRLRTLKQFVPQIPVGWITMTRLVPDQQVELIGPFWPVIFINPWYVRSAHQRGLIVCPLDPTPEAHLRYYLRSGVDAVLSDDPGKTRRELDRLTK